MNGYDGIFTLLGMSRIILKTIWGIMCGTGYLCCWRCLEGGWGSKEHSWVLWRKIVEIFYTHYFMSNFQGEIITKKGRYDGNWEFVV
jgi:hypothetical protein